MPTNSVTLCHDPFDSRTWMWHEAPDIHAFLQAQFATFPPDARIYHEQVAEENDVTPRNEAGIAKLGALEGHFYVVLYPAGPVAVVAAVVAVAAVAAVALAPDVPNVASPDLANQRLQSPNNQIARRQNRERIGARIPDIFGTVRSFPDLLSVPYRRFVGNIEYEYAYMCVGRGIYQFDLDSIREGNTRISDIGGTGVDIYDPFTSPNSEDAPYFSVGAGIDDTISRVDRVDGVANQVLLASNAEGQVGTNNIMFRAPDLLVSSVSQDFVNKLSVGTEVTIGNAEVTVPMTNQTARNFSVALGRGVSVRYYADQGLNIMEFRGSAAQINGAVSDSFVGMRVGDVVRATGRGFTNLRKVVQWFRFTEGNTRLLVSFTGETRWTSQVTTQSSGTVTFTRHTSEDIDFAGTYRIDALSDTSIRFVIERASQRSQARGAILSFPFAAINSQAADATTATTSATISGDINHWIGPFVVDSASRLVSNFVARSGLYSDDGTQRPLTVEVELEAREITGDAPTGGIPRTFRTTLTGSADARTLVAATLDINLPNPGRWSIRARRVTNTNLEFSGSYIDEIRWRDMYGLTALAQPHFGNVTTLHAVTQATQETSGVERRLNLLATRLVQERGEGDMRSSDSAADILSAVCLDPYIGNRTRDQVDFDNFYDTLAEVETYFRAGIATGFGYTFDQSNLSFEETVAIIARAVFCEAYRVGNVIRIKFERATTDAALLFNHKNKVPGTEVRSRRFGITNENDGIEYEWVDPDDFDHRTAIYYPVDRSALRPRKVESLGVRSYLQAHAHANRIWAKMQRQNVVTEFEATREANLVSRPDRILIADNTRQGTQDGEVRSQNGLELELSNPVDLSGTGPYRIFLQHSDGTTEAIPVTAGADSQQVVLGSAPRQALNLDVSSFARTTYIIGDAAETGALGFLVAEKRVRDISTASIRAVNYDPAYYLEDAGILRYVAASGFVNEGDMGGSLDPAADPNGNAAVTIDDGRFVVGTSQFANLGGTGASIVPPYSVAVSVAFTAADGFANFFGFGDRILAPFFRVTPREFGLSVAVGGNNAAAATFAVGREYHVAATYDLTDLRLYVDGGAVAVTRRMAGLADAPTDFTRVNVGASALPGFRACTFNNLRLYGRVLGPEEVARLHSLNI